eukprot:816553_1
MPHRHHTYRDQNQDLYPNDDNPVLNHSNKQRRKARKHRDRESSNSKSSSYDHNGRHRPSHRHTDYEYSFRDQDSYPHDDNPVPNHSNKHRRKHRDRESSYSKSSSYDHNGRHRPSHESYPHYGKDEPRHKNRSYPHKTLKTHNPPKRNHFNRNHYYNRDSYETYCNRNRDHYYREHQPRERVDSNSDVNGCTRNVDDHYKSDAKYNRSESRKRSDPYRDDYNPNHNYRSTKMERREHRKQSRSRSRSRRRFDNTVSGDIVAGNNNTNLGHNQSIHIPAHYHGQSNKPPQKSKARSPMQMYANILRPSSIYLYDYHLLHIMTEVSPIFVDDEMLRQQLLAIIKDESRDKKRLTSWFRKRKRHGPMKLKMFVKIWKKLSHFGYSSYNNARQRMKAWNKSDIDVSNIIRKDFKSWTKSDLIAIGFCEELTCQQIKAINKLELDGTSIQTLQQHHILQFTDQMMSRESGVKVVDFVQRLQYIMGIDLRILYND